MDSFEIESLYAAPTLAPLGPRNAPSGIVKRALPGPWRLLRDGLVGDVQGDLRNHGGPEKALHHYPRDHYPAWAAEGLEADRPEFGENISTLGLVEAEVCIGDVFALGSAQLQVSQGRQPCWKLNARFGRSDMSRRVQESGRTGWYYRVLREGVVEPGDRLRRIERPRPAWPLTRLNELLYRRTLEFDALAEMVEMPEMAASWRELAARRLAKREVEDWSSRLEGASEPPSS
jgi:MOSC domain-containing protein YiiM